MGLPFGRKAIATGTDSHAAGLTGTTTASVSVGDTANNGGLDGGTDIVQGRSVWTNDYGTTESTARSSIGLTPTATNVVVVSAGGAGMKITNDGDITMRIRKNSISGTIIASQTQSGLTATTMAAFTFQGTSANDTGISSMLVTWQASTTGMREAWTFGHYTEVNTTRADSVAAVLSGTNGIGCSLVF